MRTHVNPGKLVTGNSNSNRSGVCLQTAGPVFPHFQMPVLPADKNPNNLRSFAAAPPIGQRARRSRPARVQTKARRWSPSSGRSPPAVPQHNSARADARSRLWLSRRRSFASSEGPRVGRARPSRWFGAKELRILAGRTGGRYGRGTARNMSQSRRVRAEYAGAEAVNTVRRSARGYARPRGDSRGPANVIRSSV